MRFPNGRRAHDAAAAAASDDDDDDDGIGVVDTEYVSEYNRAYGGYAAAAAASSTHRGGTRPTAFDPRYGEPSP
jgi:hypothetical protein